MNVHVIPHTHWDREWYLPAGRFRQRLVALVDELLDDPPPAGESFLLDGQAIALTDYLAVQPQRRRELATLLKEGRIEAGPWFVLADELIPSGEALVRNLLLGGRVLRELGAEAPPVLYCPDSFGHPAALPELARGFGLPLIIAWRGYGSPRWPAGDTVEWCAPSGASAILFHLPRSGYEYGSSLPVSRDAAEERWNEMRDELVPRSRTGELLVQNGADHHARQLRYRDALALLTDVAQPIQVHGSSLRRFATAVVGAARASQVPVITGELRDSYGYTWTLQGTFGTRAQQKRRNALVERLLLRETEPWNALARLGGHASRRQLVTAAWRALLETHPHDTLCGCSIDEVADAMDVRNEDARAQAEGIARDALLSIIGHSPTRAREHKDRWRPIILLRNPSVRARGGVAELEIREFLADVPVGPGSGSAMLPAVDEAPRVPLVEGMHVQVLETWRAMDRVESPRHYPDNDLVRVTRAVAWTSAIDGYSVHARVIGGKLNIPELEERVRALPRERALENGKLCISADEEGRVAVEDLTTGRRIGSLITIEDREDFGDLYTPSIRGLAAKARFRGAKVVHRGPLRGVLRLRWTLQRAKPVSVTSTLEIDLVLDAGASHLRLDVRGNNAHDDHRLRVGIRTGVGGARVFADAAFSVIERTPIAISEAEARVEQAPETAPLHRYVSLFAGNVGATVYSDGLAEYEATRDGDVFVTLVRAVGELSRNDLPERPGHAGWPTPTPRAQSHGPFEARLALLLHGERSDATIDQVERTADDVLTPLVGDTLRSALDLGFSPGGARLEGEGLAFLSLKERENGKGIVARCVNLLDREVAGSWTFHAIIRAATLARLDETPLEPLAGFVPFPVVPFTAPPRSVVTILLE